VRPPLRPTCPQPELRFCHAVSVVREGRTQRRRRAQKRLAHNAPVAESSQLGFRWWRRFSPLLGVAERAAAAPGGGGCCRGAGRVGELPQPQPVRGAGDGGRGGERRGVRAQRAAAAGAGERARIRPPHTHAPTGTPWFTITGTHTFTTSGTRTLMSQPQLHRTVSDTNT
jgi:hypothetical protein